MTGMSMPQQTWYGAAVGYLGMWMAMMVPMMLPSLVPMLARYRRSVRGADGSPRHGSTVLVVLGYFTVWAALGAAAYGAGAGLLTLEMRWMADPRWLPLAAGMVLLLAGAMQFTSWKARQLARCRDGVPGEFSRASDPLGAWRHGLALGRRCSLSCGSLMLAWLAVGMMEPVAMGAVTLVIAGERLAPSRLRVARLAGLAIVLTSVLMITRA